MGNKALCLGPTIVLIRACVKQYFRWWVAIVYRKRQTCYNTIWKCTRLLIIYVSVCLCNLFNLTYLWRRPRNTGPRPSPIDGSAPAATGRLIGASPTPGRNYHLLKLPVAFRRLFGWHNSWPDSCPNSRPQRWRHPGDIADSTKTAFPPAIPVWREALVERTSTGRGRRLPSDRD